MAPLELLGTTNPLFWDVLITFHLNCHCGCCQVDLFSQCAFRVLRLVCKSLPMLPALSHIFFHFPRLHFTRPWISPDNVPLILSSSVPYQNIFLQLSSKYFSILGICQNIWVAFFSFFFNFTWRQPDSNVLQRHISEGVCFKQRQIWFRAEWVHRAEMTQCYIKHETPGLAMHGSLWEAQCQHDRGT